MRLLGISVGLLAISGCLYIDNDEQLLASDRDGDGHADIAAGGDDCNDQVAAISPSAAEVCDGIDNNCNNQVDEDQLAVFYADADGDGFGDANTSVEACAPTADHVPNSDDCDDTRADIAPGRPERCDGADTDCNGTVDDDPVDIVSFYVDADGDGYGADESVQTSCDPPQNAVQIGGDCNDVNPAVNPSADDVCNSADDDCDGDTDDGGPLYFADTDDDGFGDPNTTQALCAAADGWVDNDSDCDDTTELVAPGAAELCDGVDEDCDGTIDEEATDAEDFYVDQDGDGFGNPEVTEKACAPSGYLRANSSDCDDTSAAISPAAVEICNNGIDDDCSGPTGQCRMADITLVGVAPAQKGTSGDRFGRKLVAGHFNGDALLDLAVSAPQWAPNLAGLNSGKVDIWYGPVALGAPLGAPSQSVEGVLDEYLGKELKVMPGVGPGGIDGLISGADTSRSDDGRALQIANVASTAAWLERIQVMKSREGETWRLGREVGGGHDLTGNGVIDWWVTAPKEIVARNSDNNVVGRGAVYIIEQNEPTVALGVINPNNATRIAAFHGLDFGEGAASGDITGDGQADLLVGAPQTFVTGSHKPGIISLFEGPIVTDVSFDLASGTYMEGEGNNDWFGHHVAIAGDLMGTGETAWIGVASQQNVNAEPGRAYVMTGMPEDRESEVAEEAHAILQSGFRPSSGTNYSGIGWDMAAAGDVDGDGFDDLLVGAFNASRPDGTQVASGAVYLVYGPTNGVIDLDTDPSVTRIQGFQAGDELGTGVTSLGDQNGDGRDDFAIGAQSFDTDAGAVYLFAGEGQ